MELVNVRDLPMLCASHSLLLRNVAADGKILPPIRHWVIDEAHGFGLARHQWAVEISAKRDAEAALSCLVEPESGAIHAAMVGMLSLRTLRCSLAFSHAAYQFQRLWQQWAWPPFMSWLSRWPSDLCRSLRINDEVETEEWKRS